MEESRIKELIKEKYLYPDSFWENNKEWVLKLVDEVKKETIKELENGKQ